MRVHPAVRTGRRPTMVVMVMAVVAADECQRNEDRRDEHKKFLHDTPFLSAPQLYQLTTVRATPIRIGDSPKSLPFAIRLAARPPAALSA